MTNKEEAKQIDTVEIHGKQHPTYAGVLNKAHEEGLVSIQTKLIQSPLKENHYMAIMHATVTMKGEKVFEGIGDATPKNVNSMIAPHIVRMAETRAKGRALRDALNITEALYEEMGGDEPQRKTTVVKGGTIDEPVKMCPIHNVPFDKKEGKYGTFYSHKDGDGWCNEKKANEKKARVELERKGTISEAGKVDLIDPDEVDIVDLEDYPF